MSSTTAIQRTGCAPDVEPQTSKPTYVRFWGLPASTRFDALKSFGFLPYGQPTQTCNRLPSWIDRCRLHHHVSLHVLLFRWIANDSVRTPRVPRCQVSTYTLAPHDASASSLLLTRHHRMIYHTQAGARLHRMSSTIILHPIPTHHEPRDTSNSLNIVNHSSSKSDHHWSLGCKKNQTQKSKIRLQLYICTCNQM